MLFRLFFLFMTLSLTLFTGCATIQKNLNDLFIGIEKNRADLKYQTVRVEGKKVSYLERKGEGESIVLLHGFSADKNNWLRFVRYLPKTYHVLAIDMPGHGDNVQDETQLYDPVSLSRSIGKMLDALEIEQCHMAGNSLGGLVSKIYAARYPEKIITLGLFDSAGVTPPVPGEFVKGLEKGVNPFNVKTKKDYKNLKKWAFHNEPYIPCPVDAEVAKKQIKGNAFYQKMLKSLIEHESIRDPVFQEKILSRLSMPVLVIWGDKDRLLNVSSVEIYAQYIKDLETVIIKDCGHMPMLERPEETAKYYTDFILNN